MTPFSVARAHCHRAFAFFRATCRRGIYDIMSTAVDTVFVGKDRAYNRRFFQMCGLYLVEPVACTPPVGWEKGQVENQVGVVRQRFVTSRLRGKSLEELNAWLLDRCVAYVRGHTHLEFKERTVWKVFEEERPKLVAHAGRVDDVQCRLADTGLAREQHYLPLTALRPLSMALKTRDLLLTTHKVVDTA